MTDLIDELWESNRQGWSLHKLGELAGLSKRQMIRIMHGQSEPRRATEQLLAHALAVLDGRTCMHLDCTEPADYRLHLPEPIARHELACHYHARPLLGYRMPGITVEDI